MEILGGLSAFGGGLVGYVVPFLFVLTIVVFFHELGHFMMARWCGIRVLVFSIGFGPEIAGFNDRYGTRWKISAVPLGGYVKFFGDDNAASVPDHAAAAAMSEADKKDSFIFQPIRSRAAVVAAGPIANFVLAIAIFAGIFMTVGKQTTSARVDTVQAGSAAEVAGFKPGDLVLSINGEKIESFSDMQRVVSISAGEPLDNRSGSRRSAGRAQSRSSAEGDQGQLRQRPSPWRVGHQPLDGAWRHQDREGGPAPRRRDGRPGDLVRRRPDAVLHHAAYLPAGRPPTSLAGRSGSPRYRGRWRPPVLRR